MQTKAQLSSHSKPNWDNYPNFVRKEFDSRDVPGSGDSMQPEFLAKLQMARNFAGIPFKVTSGYRTVSHNRKVGGVRNSPHLGGWAADIACIASATRFKLTEAFMKAGFTRIGIGQTFIHVDCDPSKAGEPLIWGYYNGANRSK